MNKLVATALAAALASASVATTAVTAAPLGVPRIAIEDASPVVQVSHNKYHGPAIAGAVGAGVGIIIGSALARQHAAQPVHPVSDPHVLCAQRYRSYNYVTKTFRGFDGNNYLCPYWRGYPY